jgi:spore germination protein KC
MRKNSAICLVMMMLLLSGCWDQQLLKENNLVLGIGLDVTDDEQILNTAVIRVLNPESGGTGRPSSNNVIYGATGNTFRQTRAKIEKQLGGTYAPNKLRVLVLGEELAKKDIYPILDIMFRDPRNSLGAKIVVAQGTAKELLNINKSKEVFISEKLLEAVLSSEEHTLIPTETIQGICPDLFDPGKDFAIPYVIKKDPSTFEINGMALFHDKKFTGKILEEEDATILLLMNGEEGDVARFTLNVNPEEALHQNKFISTSAYLKDHSLKVKVDQNKQISVEITLKLNITAIEYPKNQLADQKEIKRLNKEITKELTKKAENVIKELQAVNCDYFGIGRKIMAYHPETWKSLDWADTFPTIDIKTNIKAEITGTGIIK